MVIESFLDQTATFSLLCCPQIFIAFLLVLFRAFSKIAITIPLRRKNYRTQIYGHKICRIDTICTMISTSVLFAEVRNDRLDVTSNTGVNLSNVNINVK